MRTIAIALILLPVLAFGQEEKTDVWQHMRFLQGKWEGLEEGVPGVGSGDREYEFVLHDKYLHHKNTSTFKPQEKNPKGEVHYDWALFSYDTGRKSYMLRSFHGEGYVITFALDEEQSSKKKFVFISESVENGPPGMRVRYTINKVSNSEINEKFELANPGQDFFTLLTNRWTKK